MGNGLESLDGLDASIIASGTLVYVAGHFSKVVGNETIQNIIVWDVVKAEWEPLYPGFLGIGSSGDFIYALALDEGILFIGGAFRFSFNRTTVENLVAYDTNTSQFFALNVSFSAHSAILAIYATNSTVYIGGRFSTLNGVIANNIASLSGGVWKTYGNGLPGLDVCAITLNELYNTLIVDGFRKTTSTSHQLMQWAVWSYFQS
jgi:hypothetical protein